MKNRTVEFRSDDLKGGQLDRAWAVTNAEGLATVAFTAGTYATEADDIELVARVGGVVRVGCIHLTVVERVLNVTRGTSNKVLGKTLGKMLGTQYALPFVVQVAVGDESLATLVGGVLETDRNGSGYFEMLYPASNADWAYVEVTARARDLGAEAEDSFRTTLPILASDMQDAEVLPPNACSPYGTDTGTGACSNTN